MSDWTKETPTPGEWWLSVDPKKRLSSFPAVIRCEVSSQSALYEGARSWLFLTDEFFVGAQWKRVEADPTDPFESPTRRNTAPVWAAARDKQLAEINKKLGR